MIFNPVHPGSLLRDYLGALSVAEADRTHVAKALGRFGDIC